MVAWQGFSLTCESWYNTYHHPHQCGLLFYCIVPVWQGCRLLGWGSWTLQLQLLQTQPGQQGIHVQSSSEILWASPLLLSVPHLYPALSLPDPNPKSVFRCLCTACVPISTSQLKRHDADLCSAACILTHINVYTWMGCYKIIQMYYWKALGVLQPTEAVFWFCQVNSFFPSSFILVSAHTSNVMLSSGLHIFS